MTKEEFLETYGYFMAQHQGDILHSTFTMGKRAIWGVEVNNSEELLIITEGDRGEHNEYLVNELPGKLESAGLLEKGELVWGFEF